MITQKRLLKELHHAKKQSCPMVKLEADPDNLFQWHAEILPPEPYHGYWHLLKIDIPHEYPLEPPICKFVTPICHPNIHFKTGEICLNVLKNEWSPSLTLHSVCQSILLLLSTPDITSPLNCDAANLLRIGDERGYRSLCQMYASLYGRSSFY